MIDCQDLTLRQINDLKNLFSSKENGDICSQWIGEYVIVRTYSAGVHCGILEKKSGNEVILKDARRIWSWRNAFTLSKISIDGLGDESKLSIEIPKIKLTEIEIIPCSEKSKKILKEFKEYVP